MFNFGSLRAALVSVAIATGLFAAPAAAQTAGTRITVGANPRAIAVNPITNKVYVANADADTVSVINANTGGVTTVPVGDYPAWIGINTETNMVYVSNLTGANTTIINGATDTVSTTVASGGGGWTAINPLIDTAYVVRYGSADEVNVIQGQLYELTSATRSFTPTALALNPNNNWLYIVHQGIGKGIVVMDMTTPQPYPPLKCPDGSGGFRAQPPIPPPGSPDTWTTPCIDVPGMPVAVAVNPITNKIYAVSTSGANQISVINGADSTFISLTPAGALGDAKAIAVNPVNNKVYAAFATAVVVIDGTTNAMTVLPAGSATGGPVAIGINPLTSAVYVPNSDGTMMVIDGGSNATSTIGIAAGANGIAVNPLTNMIYVLDSAGGVTPVTGYPGSTTSTGISTSVVGLPGNSTPPSGSITIDASTGYTGALEAVRKVYFRIDSGPWTVAPPTGTSNPRYTASFSGLSTGSHTLQAFATNSLEAPSINTDLANVPILGNVTSYNFTVTADPNANDLSLTQSSSANPASVGKDVMFTLTATNNGPNTATGVTITNTIPAGSSFIWASASCANASGTVTCNLGSMANGSNRVVKVVVRPGSTGAVTNTATVTATQGDPNTSNNTSAQGITVNASPVATAVTRYRLYSPGTQEHLFTTDQNEYNVLGASGAWQQEGASGKVLNNPGSFNGVTAVPYYRLYNSQTFWHHWTTDANEYYTLDEFAQWVGEGVDGYLLPTATAGATQLYRLLYPDGRGLHHWTIDATEYSILISQYGWIGEGGSGYVIQ